MKYEILFSEGAVKDLKSVPSKDQIKIIYKIEKLSGDPYPKGCKKLKTSVEDL